MTLFRAFLAIYMVALASYTAVTISQHGINLLPVFFGDIAKMAWPGQFNFDFSGFLALSAIWVAWRHRFTPAGLVLGLVAFFGGMMFLSIYLLIQTARTRGDMEELLLGPERA